MAVKPLSSKAQKQEVVLPTGSANGKLVQLAPLQTISLAKIHNHESVEIHRLEQAARYPGFFYLEVPDSMQAKVCLLGTLANELCTQGFRDIIPEGPSNTRAIQVKRESVYSYTDPDLPVSIQSRLPALRDGFHAGDEVCIALLQALNTKTQKTSKLTMAAFKDREPTACTTEIFMPGTGLSHDQSWAEVVPKHGSVLVGLEDARHRIADTLPGKFGKVWAQYDIY